LAKNIVIEFHTQIMQKLGNGPKTTFLEKKI